MPSFSCPRAARVAATFAAVLWLTACATTGPSGSTAITRPHLGPKTAVAAPTAIAEPRLPAAEFAARLVDLTLHEWRDFGMAQYDFSSGTARPVHAGALETDTGWLPPAGTCTQADAASQRNGCHHLQPFDAAARIVGYWDIGLAEQYAGRFADMDAEQRATWASSDGNPWSAAFTSYLMRRAGAGNPFPYDAAHAVYLRALFASAADPARAFDLLAAVDTPVRPGDLLCAPRDDDNQPDTITLPVVESAYDVGRIRRSHCDVVVALRPESGAMDVVGGNVFDTVSMSTVPLSRQGLAVRILERPWALIVRAR